MALPLRVQASLILEGGSFKNILVILTGIIMKTELPAKIAVFFKKFKKQDRKLSTGRVQHLIMKIFIYRGRNRKREKTM